MQKRVLITSGVFPPDIGGPARMIEQLASDLRELDFDIRILTFGKAPDELKVSRAKGKKDFILKLIRLKSEFDIIYTFDLYTAGFISWFIGKKILKKKLIVRFAGDSAWELAANKGQTKDDILTFQRKFYGLSVVWHKWLRKCILFGADRVVAVSEFMKEVAIAIGVPKEKIKVIYNSVDFTYRQYLRAYPLPDSLIDKKMILTVGRLVPWKGADLLIKALAKIDDNKLVLWIVGNGPDIQRLRLLAESLKVSERIEFKSKVSLDEVFKYYYLADVLVLDSQYEGLSHVLLEALMAVKPIIASRSGGNPEVIKNERNGLLIDYGNVEQLVVAIKRMLTEEKWHSVDYKEKCHISLKKFNWQNVIEQTSKIIEELKP